MARVGFDNVIGYLKGGFDSWIESGQPFDQIQSISTLEFYKLNSNKKLNIFDVRSPNEYNLEHVKEAINIPLAVLKYHINDFPKQNLFYIYCAAGYRSMIASSILKHNGIHNLINVQGGLKSIKKFNLLINNWFLLIIYISRIFLVLSLLDVICCFLSECEQINLFQILQVLNKKLYEYYMIYLERYSCLKVF